MLKVTTSWDDGDILDKRLSSLLSLYGIKGTFYIARNYQPRRLSDDEIRKLANEQEIGAHTLNHPDLRNLSQDEQWGEIKGSKQWLEELQGFEIKMFCYPKGLANDLTMFLTKKAGFWGARNVRSGFWVAPDDYFDISTTIQVYPFPFRKLGKRKYYWMKLLEPYQKRAPKFLNLGVSRLSMISWLSLAKATFDLALQNGEVFHLWGHSWEIDKYDMWDELEKLLKYISQRENCVYLTNSEILQKPCSQKTENKATEVNS